MSHRLFEFQILTDLGLQGQFRNALPAPNEVVGATKWCVFRPVNPTRAVVEAAVAERMERMQTTRVDLLQVRHSLDRFQPAYTFLQFHWNDYSNKGYLTALQHLQDLQDEGQIADVGLCNFDTIHTDEICTQLGPNFIVSNQVQVSSCYPPDWLHCPHCSPIQFSLIDTRPLHGMADVCEKHGVKLLTYGTLVRSFLLKLWSHVHRALLFSVVAS